jgi:hypothetical protein
MRADSIMQAEKKCFQTGRTDNLHCHHIFGAANRKISDKNGFWVWLTGEWHNQDSRIDVHHNIEFDQYLKRECQERFEETGNREDFVKLIGRSYL